MVAAETGRFTVAGGVGLTLSVMVPPPEATKLL